MALDAVLLREAAVRFDDLVSGHVGLPLERVDVLREAGVEKGVISEQLHEGVCERRPEAARVKLVGEGVDYWKPSK